MLAPLFAITLALPATGGETTFEVAASAHVGYATFERRPEDHTLLAGGSARVTLFPGGVTDDDAPPALQPFLQRKAEVTLAGGGSRYVYTMPSYPAPLPSLSTGDASAEASGYVAGKLYLLGRFGVHYETFDQSAGTRIALPLRLAFGGRWRDLLVDAGWDLTPTRLRDGDGFRVPFYGSVFVNAYGVVHRRLALGAFVQVLEGGAEAGGRGTVWLARRFGLGARILGGHTDSATFAYRNDFVSGRALVEVWLSSRAAIAVAYEAGWQRYRGRDVQSTVDNEAITHFVSLEVTGRPW